MYMHTYLHVWMRLRLRIAHEAMRTADAAQGIVGEKLRSLGEQAAAQSATHERMREEMVAQLSEGGPESRKRNLELGGKMNKQRIIKYKADFHHKDR